MTGEGKSVASSVASEFAAIFGASKSIKGLDGLRAVCVLVVLGVHAELSFCTEAVGKVVVYIFFTISGFLIIPILFRAREAVEAGGTTIRRELHGFLVNRMLRIFPIYYIALTFAVLPLIYLAVKKGNPLAPAYVEQIPYLYGYAENIYFGFVTGHWTGWISHFWTLSVEQQYYLILPLVAFAAPTRLWRQTIGGFALLCAVLAWVIAGNGPDIPFYVNSFTGFFAMTVGGLFALYGQRLVGRMAAIGPSLFVLLMAVAMVVLSEAMQGPTIGNIATLIIPVFSSMLLLAVSLNQESVATRILDWPALRGIGVVSYSFYIFHNLVLGQAKAPTLGLMKLAGVDDPQVGSTGYLATRFVLAFIATFLISAVSFIFIEKRFLRLKRHFHPALKVSQKASAPQTA